MRAGAHATYVRRSNRDLVQYPVLRKVEPVLWNRTNQVRGQGAGSESTTHADVLCEIEAVW